MKKSLMHLTSLSKYLQKQESFLIQVLLLNFFLISLCQYPYVICYDISTSYKKKDVIQKEKKLVNSVFETLKLKVYSSYSQKPQGFPTMLTDILREGKTNRNQIENLGTGFHFFLFSLQSVRLYFPLAIPTRTHKSTGKTEDKNRLVTHQKKFEDY